jgi:SAM-dependent methyltransferase
VAGRVGHCSCFRGASASRRLGVGSKASVLISFGIRPWLPLGVDRDCGASRRPFAGRTGWVRLEPGWRSLPSASAASDVVMDASVFNYVAEPGAVLRECARVLRRGGVVLYTVPDLRRPIWWAKWLNRRLVGVMRAPSGDGCRSGWYGYHTYLRASRQRHRVPWWLAAAGTVGLRTVRFPADCGQPTLRVLAFRRDDKRASGSRAPLYDRWRVLQ